jgi:hypothetical protein
MRQLCIVLIVFSILIACNNSDIKTTTSSETEQQFDPAKSSRPILIEELKRLREIIASNNKERIAGIFGFPLPDTSFSVYIEDNTFSSQFESNGNKITKSMFLHYFKEISESIWLDQLNNLFQHIHIDSLLYKDTLEHAAYLKTEPCFYSYKIEVIKDSVVLKMDINANQNYKSKYSSDNHVPENSSEVCEHSFWWNFSFDGKKLHFKNIAGAD